MYMMLASDSFGLGQCKIIEDGVHIKRRAGHMDADFTLLLQQPVPYTC